MKVVDRHLAAEFLGLFFVSAAAFLSLFLVVEFFENLGMFLKYHPRAGDVLLFFTARLPWMATQVVPMATLLGTLLSLTLLSRHGEVTALRCSGLSLSRLFLPYLGCGLLLVAATGFLQEVLAPRGFSLGQEVKNVRIKGKSPLSLLRSEDLWLRSGTRMLHVAQAGPEEGRLEGVSVAEVEGSHVARRIDASEALWVAGGWQLKDAVIRTFRADGTFTTERRDSLPYPLGQGPGDFEFAKRLPEEESWSDLGRQIERYRAQGLETRELEVDRWAKTSMPFVNLIMPLLAFPFAVGAGRRGSASLGLVLALSLGFAYWLVLAVGLSLGKTGALPPPLAAWSGNLLFAGLGCYLLRRAERGA